MSPLIMALGYTQSQEHPNAQVSYFIITFRSKYLPLAMLASTFVMASPQAALLQCTGLVAAHAYEFATNIWPEYGGGRPLLATPSFVRGWFAAAPRTGVQRGAGTAYQAGRTGGGGSGPAPGRQAGGWTSGFSGGPWGGRGPGRRLG